MRSKIITCVLFSVIFVFAANYSVFDVNGKKVKTQHCEEEPACEQSIAKAYSKAVVLVREGESFFSERLPAFAISDESIAISLRDSATWVEVEKNQTISLCVEDGSVGSWSVSNLSFRVQNDSCVQIGSGNVVKTSNVKYISKKGKIISVDVYVGMKRIDLSKQMHELGYYGRDFSLKKKVLYKDSLMDFNNKIYPDPVRISSMESVMAVDEYKVTNCEIIQTLWDSIPTYSMSQEKIIRDYHNYWIEKKKNAVRNGSCDAHDSAAIMVNLYDALIYANARSTRDGFEPVYTFQKVEKKNHLPRLYLDGSFDVYTASFFEKYENVDNGWLHVKVNKKANGYRLPYYDEWMALAKAGKIGRKYVWGNSESKDVASQYAWFGEGTVISEKYGVYRQESKPVGVKKPNEYGLYDMTGLVCENVMLPGKSLFANEITSCKGGFLSDSLQSLNFGFHKDNAFTGFGGYQGLRLVRVIK